MTPPSSVGNWTFSLTRIALSADVELSAAGRDGEHADVATLATMAAQLKAKALVCLVISR